MAVIQREVSVLANAVVDNLISGSAFEFLRQNSVVSIGVTAAATGLQVTINSGADIVVEESAIYIKTQFPVIPDEMFYTDVGAAGDRLVIRIRNTTAGAITVRCIVQVTAI